MAAVSYVSLASASCVERITALEGEQAEVLGSREAEPHARPVLDKPDSSSQRSGIA